MAAVASLSLGGCATLPSSGPTAHQILKSEKQPANTIGFVVVPIDGSTIDEVAKEDQLLAARQPSFVPLSTEGRNDRIGPGDVLQISVYEVGVALFGAGNAATAQGFDPSARGQAFPPITVDHEGAITLPYVGRIIAAGRTPSEIQHMIEQGLRTLSQKPQALVTVKENIANTIEIFGDVRRPGRLPLGLSNERLSDAIANSGGGASSSEDTIVRIARAGLSYEERLRQIRPGTRSDPLLLPGDRIELIKRPRTFLVLGASGKVSQVPFETGDVSLAEAVARGGGSSDTAGDPSAIFLFRYVQQEGSAPPKPIIYRLNLMEPSSYFLAQHFQMRDKDVLYVGNAAANQPSKLITIINQLFSPFVTARVLTQ